MVYVVQNSRDAVPWSSLRTRSGSFTPGSSTSIRPVLPSFWIEGWVTPKRSIRLRSTLNELSTALWASSWSTAITCSSEVSEVMRSRISNVPNTWASLCPPETSFHASAKRVMKSDCEFTLRWLASSMAFWNSGVVLLPESARTRSSSCTCSITFIPPLRSRPRFISWFWTCL